MNIAVIKTGGKQYKVSEGNILDIELVSDIDRKVDNTKKTNTKKDEKRVLEFNDLLTNKKVIAEILKEKKGIKINTLKFKNKTRYTKRIGHRQKYFVIKITSIK